MRSKLTRRAFVRAGLGSLTALLLLAGQTPPAYASFQDDPTPVDVRAYWPSDYRVTKYRRYDGSLYVKRITKPVDPMAIWEAPPQPGEVHFSREDHFPAVYGSEVTYFNNSWSMVKRPDKAVWEIADSFPLSSTCPDWCASSGSVYRDGAILHGRPGGHTLGEDYYMQYGVKVDSTPNLSTTPPTPLPGWEVFTVTKLVQKYDTFTPEYGRGSGSWGAGRARTYNDVILMVMAHGVKDPGRPNGTVCRRYPAGIAHHQGYTSFWVYSWLAPGTNEIQSWILFDERTCDGWSLPKAGVPPVAYEYFIDDG